jgi:hypothetical protein
MDISKITFRSGKLFPFQFQYFAILLSIISLLLLISYPFFSPLPLILALTIFTGSYGLEFLTEEKRYRTFNSILFIKKGQWKPYSGIEKIYLTTSSRSQKIYTRVTEGPTIRKKYYNAFMKFTDGNKEFLQSKKTKSTLIHNLEKLSEKLELEITDHTE